MTSRRSFLKAIIASALLSPPGVYAATRANARVIVIGGGVAGTRAAAYLKLAAPAAEITLFEPALKASTDSRFHTIKRAYSPVSRAALEQMGVTVKAEPIVRFNAADRTVQLAGNQQQSADMVIVAPGIMARNENIEGQQHIASSRWQYPDSEAALYRRIAAMDNGDNVVVRVPLMPYRFPDGPYHRALKVARLLATHKPASKVIVLDSNDSSALISAYAEELETELVNALEWHSGANGGRVERLDLDRGLVTASGERIKVGLLDFTPAQRASAIASASGLCVDSDWCQVNVQTLESIHYQGVYVVGDANDASLLNKTAAAADAQAVLLAKNLASSLS